MISTNENPPPTEKELQSVATWVETNVQPVMREVAARQAATVAVGGGDLPQLPTSLDLRDYQLDAWARLERARNQGVTRALGHLATGLGKTFIAGVDIMRYQEKCQQQRPPIIPRILYVSHRHSINEQAAQTFARLMPDAEVEFFDTKKKRYEADLTFAALRGLYTQLHRFDPHDFEYIVWDESHHLEARTFRKVRDFFKPLFEHAVTATVDRMDGLDIQAYFGAPLYRKTLPESIAERRLADVDYNIVFDKALRRQLSSGQLPETLLGLKKMFSNRPPLEAIAQNINEEIERLGLEDPKTIIFCRSIDEADHIAGLLGAVPYHSESPSRAQTLASFRAGRLRRITARDLLNEGVDIPDAELIIFLRSTSSTSVFEQQLGRGLRRGDGKEKVYVLDFVANVERILHVRDLSDAISRQAAVQQAKGGQPASRVTDTEAGGMRVQAAYSSFGFEKLAVDILDRFGVLRNTRGYSLHVGQSNEELVRIALEHKPDGPLSLREINELSAQKLFVSAPTLMTRFGSMAAFQRACGFDVQEIVARPSWHKMTNDEIVALALKLQPDKPLTNRQAAALCKKGEFMTVATIEKRFGSMAEFHVACGFERRMTNEEVIAIVKQRSPDRQLTGEPLRKLHEEIPGFPNQRMIQRRFGSMNKFHQACGFAPVPLGRRVNPTEYLSREVIIERVRELGLDRPLTRDMVTRLSKEKKLKGISSVYRFFDSLADLNEACGLSVSE